MKKENIPNILTIGRILFIPIFVLFLSFGESPLLHGIAAIIFSLASITDYLDGYLARKWGVVSNFGKFADPMADKLLVMAALILLVQLNHVKSINSLILKSPFLIIQFVRHISLYIA